MIAHCVNAFYRLSMTTPVAVDDDRVGAELKRLVALSSGGSRIEALIRPTCGQALSLPPLPAEVEVTGAESDAESAVVEFAEQFSTDVSMITDIVNRSC